MADERYAMEGDDTQLLPQLYFGPRDAHGAPIKSGMVWLLRRTAQVYNLRSGERSAVTMETRIRKLASQLGFPSTLALRAIFIFRKTRKMHVLKKPGLQDWALALLYTACRDTRYVVTVEDIVGNPDDARSISTVWAYFKNIKRALGLKLLPFTVQNYITYYSGKLRVNGVIVAKALHVAATNAKANATPHCVAAGALYISMREAGYDISQKEFCTHANVSEISLRHWVTGLGGFSVPDRSPPDIVLADVSEEGQDVDGKSEETPEDDGQNPPPPEEPKRDDDRADDDNKLDDRRSVRHGVRKSRNHPANPVRLLNLPKKRTDKRNQTAYRKNAQVKRHGLIPRRRPRRRSSRSSKHSR